jgi:hypothetical protein
LYEVAELSAVPYTNVPCKKSLVQLDQFFALDANFRSGAV